MQNQQNNKTNLLTKQAFGRFARSVRNQTKSYESISNSDDNIDNIVPSEIRVSGYTHTHFELIFHSILFIDCSYGNCRSICHLHRSINDANNNLRTLGNAKTRYNSK